MTSNDCPSKRGNIAYHKLKLWAKVEQQKVGMFSVQRDVVFIVYLK